MAGNANPGIFDNLAVAELPFRRSERRLGSARRLVHLPGLPGCIMYVTVQDSGCVFQQELPVYLRPS